MTDAALCFTAERGWHLQPSRELSILIKSQAWWRRAHPPRWHLDVAATRAANAGYDPEYIDRRIERWLDKEST